jgi:hypothetical protein
MTFFLVLLLVGSVKVSVIIPEPYPTEEACRVACEIAQKGSSVDVFLCVPAPEVAE